MSIRVVATYARSDHGDAVILTDENNPSCNITARSRLGSRMLASLRAQALDRALAAGASPDASAAVSRSGG